VQAATESGFIKAADALADKEETPDYSADTATLALRSKKADLTSSYNEALANWLFEGNRKTGDATVIESESAYFVLYLKRTSYALFTVDFYTINVPVEQPDSVDGATEEETAVANIKAQADAKAKADDLLARWKKDGSTKVAFEALVKEAAEKSGETAEADKTLGLTEKAKPGDSGETALDNWLYDATRTNGQATVIETSSGYKVLYLSKLNKTDFIWKSELSDTHVSEDYQAYLEGLRKQYPLKEHKAGLWFALKTAEQMCVKYIAWQAQQAATNNYTY
jgi:hypothetical protein